MVGMEEGGRGTGQGKVLDSRLRPSEVSGGLAQVWHGPGM